MGKFDLETLVNRRNIGSLKESWTPLSLRKANMPAFNGGEMDFKTAPAIIDAIVKCAKEGIYGFTIPDDKYLNAIAWWMKTQRHHAIDKNWIVPTLGTIFSVATCIRMTMPDKDDCLIVQPPTYPRYKQAADRLSRKTLFNPLKHNSDGSYEIDFDDLEAKMANPHSKLLVFCNPNNPLGKVWPKSDLEKVAKLAIKYHVIVYSDEIFADYTFEKNEVYPYFLINNGNNNGISAIGLGKTFNFTGVNHAIMLIKDASLRARFVKQRTSDHYGSLDPLVRAAVIGGYSKAGAEWKNAVHDLINDNYHQLKKVFNEILPEINLAPLEGGYIAWADWRAWKITDTNLLKLLTDQALFLPESGHDFHVQENGFTRINLATPRHIMLKMLQNLRAAIAKLHKHEVNISLQPFENAKKLKVTVRINNAHYQPGDIFDQMPEYVTICPSAQYDQQTLQFTHHGQKINYHIKRVSESNGHERQYILDQAVSGELTIKGTTFSHQWDKYRGDPHMNFIQHHECSTCASLMFLLLPKRSWSWYHIHYDWSQMPGGQGACGWAVGDFSRYCSAADLKNQFFAFGNLQIQYEFQTKLRIVKLEPKIKKFDQLISHLKKLFSYMQEFFDDVNEPFTIFIYPTPRAVATGTGYNRANCFGFGDTIIKNINEVDDTLAHELVHNWLVFHGDSDEDLVGSLYDEGSADYYSGLMVEKALKRPGNWTKSLNKKLQTYYSNPLRSRNCQKNFADAWKRTYALRTVYGRGVLMLMKLNSLIKKFSHGKNSLKDLQIKVARAHMYGNDFPFQLFKKEAIKLGGSAAKAIFKETLDGGTMVPPADFFSPIYRLVNVGVPQEDLGFANTVRFENPSIIHDLVPNSNAAKAGLQNGDTIVQFDSDWNTMDDPTRLTNITVKRDNKKLTFKYLARGKTVDCWQYSPERS